MLSSPLIFPEKIDFWEHVLLRQGTGYHWNTQGQLVDMYGLEKTTQMKYEDLNDLEHRLSSSEKEYHPIFKQRDDYELMMYQAQRMQRQFIERNIDIIVGSEWTKNVFRPSHHLTSTQKAWVEQTQSFDHALCFHFPDNIQQDWALGLESFLNWTEKKWKEHFGWDGKTQSKDHWPEPVQKMQEKIQATRKRLHPLAHQGQTLEEFYEMRAKNAQVVLDMLNKFKHRM